MFKRKSSFVILDRFRIRKAFIVISILNPIDAVEHRQEGDSIFKLFWICLTNCHYVLSLLKMVQRCVSWENIPLELE